MSTFTHKTKHRLLAGFTALICLCSLMFGYVPKSYADPLPVNVELFLRDGSGEIATEYPADHVYSISGNSQDVFVRLNISFNGFYDDDQLRVEIPYRAFSDRNGNAYELDHASWTSLIAELGDPSSLMYIADNGYNSGTIVLYNRAASALQMNLYLTYSVNAFTVGDGERQDYSVTVTDTESGDSNSAELHPTFETHVNSVSVSKSVADLYAPRGCYYEWHSSLDEIFKLSELGIIDGEDEFNSLCDDYYFVAYTLTANARDVNQLSTIYINETPENGEVIAVSYRNIYTGAGILYFPLEKETEGEYAGQWRFDDWIGRSSETFFALARYPKSGSYEMVADPESGEAQPSLSNSVSVTYVGLDGHTDDVAYDTAALSSIWQTASAGEFGNIWGVVKKGYPDPAGALNILRNGKDVTFRYDITGVGKTYRYVSDKDFEKANSNNVSYEDYGGPYRLDLVDDALYVNGLGDSGTETARLLPEDFHFKTFTLKVKHDVVAGVDLKGNVREKESQPAENRKPVEVWVITEDEPDVWVLDQCVSEMEPGSSTRYINADGGTEFTFVNDKVYRIKFVYNNANGDIQLDSTISGVLRADGSTVQRVLDNIEAKDIANFQLFNWDAEMGYDANDTWLDPQPNRHISAPDDMKEDLINLDIDLYDEYRHEQDRISDRQVAKNNLTEVKFYSGAAKQGFNGSGYENGLLQTERSIKGKYVIAAITGGGASSDENLKELVEMGVLPESKEIVFHELLPVGMKITDVRSLLETSYYSYDFHDEEYSWDHFSHYASWFDPVNREIPDISYTAVDNYKGTMRQMVKITVKYDELPIVKLGSSTIDVAHYALGSILVIDAEANYSDLRSQTLDNNITAQFYADGEPFELDGTAVYPDDGSVFGDILDGEGNSALEDLDGDGDTEENTIVGADASATWNSVVSTTQLIKAIKEDELDEDFSDHTQTYAGHNYTYKLQFLLGGGTVKNLVIFDSIEQAYDDPKNIYSDERHWKGKLRGVDIADAENMGFDDITVYVNTSKYYTNAELATDYAAEYPGLTPADLTEENGWTVVDPDSYTDWEKVKTIAFGFGEDTVFSTQDNYPRGVSVYLKMKAPDTIHAKQTATDQVLAYNQPAYYSEKKALGENWDPDTTIANVVTIGVKSATAEIPAITKIFTGEDRPAGYDETCIFDIKPAGHANAPRAYDAENNSWGDEIDSISLTLNADQTTAVANDNGRLLFTEPSRYQAYEYEISERRGSTSGVNYSGAKYRVVYTVTDEREDADGNVPQYAENTLLDVETKIYMTHNDLGEKIETPIEVDSIVFSNRYEIAPCELTLPVVIKEIDGDLPEGNDKTFSFELSASESEAPMPDPSVVTVTGSGEANAFGTIHFTEADVYTYDIFEQELDESCTGFSRDNSVYRLTVTVTDIGGRLSATYVITKNGTEVSELRFVNSYAPDVVGASLMVEKVVEGDAPEQSELYTFELNGVDGTPVPENNIATVIGQGVASFESWEYTAAGVYVYEVTEIAGDNENCEYDSTVYVVTDTVTDNDGVLVLSRVITVNDTEADNIVFVNTYEEEEDSSSESSSSSSSSSESSSSSNSTSESSSSSNSSSESSSSSNSSSESSSSSNSSSESSSSSSSSTTSSTGAGSQVTSDSVANTGIAKGTGAMVCLIALCSLVIVKKKSD